MLGCLSCHSSASSTAMADEEHPEKVFLKSSDNEDFEVEYDVGCMSVTVKNMLEDTGSAAPIPGTSWRAGEEQT